jgi:hypothetical protein
MATSDDGGMLVGNYLRIATNIFGGGDCISLDKSSIKSGLCGAESHPVSLSGIPGEDLKPFHPQDGTCSFQFGGRDGYFPPKKLGVEPVILSRITSTQVQKNYRSPVNGEQDVNAELYNFTHQVCQSPLRKARPLL